MNDETIVRYTITIRGRDQAGVARRIDRLMAWLHLASSWGHSGTVAMSLDGDGWEKVSVDSFTEDSRKFIEKLQGRSRERRVEFMHQEAEP